MIDEAVALARVVSWQKQECESVIAEGPYFDELSVGQVFGSAPGFTLSDGRAAAHQAIVGDRLRRPLDDVLAGEVAGLSPLAHPALVWDVAIGQSTLVTHHVKANLFYRGLAFRRAPQIGDTLFTITTVVGLRQNSRREGRSPTGLVALRIETVDQADRSVLDFWRCAMLPLREEVDTGHADELDRIAADPDPDLLAFVAGWNLERFRTRVGLPGSSGLRQSMRIEVAGGDVVSSAPELARLSLNIAQVHHDAAAEESRQVLDWRFVALFA